MAEVASAYVSLLPSARGFGKKLEGQVGGEVKKSGSKLGGFLGKSLKAGAVGVAAAAGGAIGTALFKGFNRLQGIEQAEAKLSGLGHSAKSVDKIMTNALASVKGTAFGLDEAATTAAGAVAAGVKPGQALERTLKLVGDAATIGGTSMAEMGAIFNKVAASDMIQGEVLAQLGDRGIPILQLLGKEMGVTAAEVKDLASKGKVDFATFQKAMESGMGGAALKSGQTFKGALANMQAALGRLGANLLGGVFEKLPNLFGKVTGALDGLGPTAAKVGEAIGSAFGKVGDRLRKIDWAAVGEKLRAAFDRVKKVVGDLAATFGPLVRGLGSAAIKAAPGIFDAIKKALDAAGDALSAITGFMRGHKTAVQAVAVVVAGAVIGWKAYTVAVKVWAVAAKVAAIAQRVLNAAMKANPIGLVVAALVGLAAGLVYAYKKSETFRNIVNGAFQAVRSAAGRLVSAFNTLGTKIGAFVGTVRAKFGEMVSTVAGIPGRITALGGKFAAAGRSIIRAFVNALSNAGGFVSDIAGNIWNAVKGMLNSAISRINAALEFTIAIPKAPDIHINPPNIPYLAKGGPVSAGSPYIVGEEGPELFMPTRSGRIIPNHKLGSSGGALGAGNVTILTRIGDVDVESYIEAIVEDKLRSA